MKNTKKKMKIEKKNERTSRFVGCKLTDEMKKNFKNACKIKRRTMSNVLKLFIEQYVNDNLEQIEKIQKDSFKLRVD